ncbi:MAG: hypothetical protein Q9226_001158 [Calogaya cf. arnoldii]
MGVCSDVLDVSPTIISTPRAGSNKDGIPPGNDYSVPDTKDTKNVIENGPVNQIKKPSFSGKVLSSVKNGDTLWVGSQDTANKQYERTNQLMRFYVIYVRNLTSWNEIKNFKRDHKDELTALQVTLDLCLYTYTTNMTFGVTSTTEVTKKTDLQWKVSTDPKRDTTYMETTNASETFSMSEINQWSWNNFLTYQTFLGAAQYRPRGGPENTTENDVVRSIANSLYNEGTGIEGLSRLMDNLALSMTNTLRTTTETPEKEPGSVTSNEVHFQFLPGWMAVPVASVILSLTVLLLTIFLSQQRKLPAWKTSILAILLSPSPTIRRDLGGAKRPFRMEEQAQGRNIRLDASGGQWQIVDAAD